MRVSRHSSLAGLLLTAGLTSAIELDLDSEESIISASRTIVNHIFTIYKGNETSNVPGLLPNTYYWWESGLMFDSLINYWAASGDDDLTEVIGQALAFQVGPFNNYMPLNQTKALGNDDQSTWANAAMTAAELGFPKPADLNVTWLELAENVFNDQVLRWDETSCGGGLKWQVFTFNNGYNYKNSVSSLSFATLATRLARFTGNATYTDWAQRSVDWLETIGLVSLPSSISQNNASSSSSSFRNNRVQIFDGTDDTLNCSEINHIEWSQNAGLFLSAAAYASSSSNTTSSPQTWSTYINGGVLYANTTFATPQFSNSDASASNNGILGEPACMPSGNCNIDQRAMRASLARGLARARDLTSDSPLTAITTSANGGSSSESSTHEVIDAILRTSAAAAAKQCVGGESGDVCGFNWQSDGENDGMEGIGEDLAALEVILACLKGRKALATAEGVEANSTSSGGNAGSGGGAGSRNGTEAQGDENAAPGRGASIVGVGAVVMGALVFLI